MKFAIPKQPRWISEELARLEFERRQAAKVRSDWNTHVLGHLFVENVQNKISLQKFKVLAFK